MGQGRDGVQFGHDERIVGKRNFRRRGLVSLTTVDPRSRSIGYAFVTNQIRASRTFALDMVPGSISGAVCSEPGGREQHVEEAAGSNMVLLRSRRQVRPRGRLCQSPA